MRVHLVPRCTGGVSFSSGKVSLSSPHLCLLVVAYLMTYVPVGEKRNAKGNMLPCIMAFSRAAFMHVFFFPFHHAFVKTINNAVCFWLYNISKLLILTVPRNSLSAFYLCWSAPHTAVWRRQIMFSESNLTDIAKVQRSTPAHITRLNEATAGRWEKSPLKRLQRSSNSWYADIQMPPTNSVFWDTWKA